MSECRCSWEHLEKWGHDPWCPMNRLYGKRPQVSIVYASNDEPTPGVLLYEAFRLYDVNAVAFHWRGLGGPAVGWFFNSDYGLLLAKPGDELKLVSESVQWVYDTLHDIYEPDPGCAEPLFVDLTGPQILFTYEGLFGRVAFVARETRSGTRSGDEHRMCDLIAKECGNTEFIPACSVSDTNLAQFDHVIVMEEPRKVGALGQEVAK